MAKEVSSLKKAYCPHCKTDNELDRIFMVSPDAEVCYCPNCMKEYKPKDVIDNYNYFISTKITRAERLLYRDTKFYDAYCAFADIIDIDSTSCKARFGRILSLIYMSKLRKTNFANATLLLDNEADQYFHKLKDQTSYVKFLSRATAALDEYEKRLHKKITIRDRFYNEDCVALYFQRLFEIIQMKKTLLEELQKSWAKANDSRTEHLIRNVEETINILNVKFNAKVITTEGVCYKVAKVASPTQILVATLDERQNPIAHYVRYKLVENEKRGKLLNDKVYPDNIHITALIKAAWPLMIIFYIVSVGSFIATFFVKNSKYDLILYIVAACSLVAAITWMVLFIVWKAQLSKRHHLID